MAHCSCRPATTPLLKLSVASWSHKRQHVDVSQRRGLERVAPLGRWADAAWPGGAFRFRAAEALVSPCARAVARFGRNSRRHCGAGAWRLGVMEVRRRRPDAQLLPCSALVYHTKRCVFTRLPSPAAYTPRSEASLTTPLST